MFSTQLFAEDQQIYWYNDRPSEEIQVPEEHLVLGSPQSQGRSPPPPLDFQNLKSTHLSNRKRDKEEEGKRRISFLEL